jgi:polar amino acid transport system substrate-binding protein
VSQDRRAILAGLAALAFVRPAYARIYADTVNLVGASLDQLRTQGRLRIGVYADFVPFSILDGAGTPVGVDVDLARLIAERLGLALDLVLVQAGDSVEDDLRNYVWRGSPIDRSVVNLLLHVPYDRALETRSELAVLVQPYFTETLVVARDLDQVGAAGLEGLSGLRVGVELDSLADHYLGSAMGGLLRDGLVHFRRPEAGLAALLNGEVAAFMGLRSQVEAGLGHARGRFDLGTMDLPGLRMTEWAIGAAVRENARDLGYAAGDIMAAAVRDGTMRRIFAAHGIGFGPPPFA